VKTISTGLDAHLKQEVTTLCTCWKIVRQDGKVFGFTDHDDDVVFDGIVYECETGYNRTAITNDERCRWTISMSPASLSPIRSARTIFATACSTSPRSTSSGQLVGPHAERDQASPRLVRRGHGQRERLLRDRNSRPPSGALLQLHGELSAGVPRRLLRRPLQAQDRRLYLSGIRLFGGVALGVPRIAATGRSDDRLDQRRRSPVLADRVTGSYYTDYVGFAEIKFFDQRTPSSAAAIPVPSRPANRAAAFSASAAPTTLASKARDGNNNSSWQCKQDDAAIAWWQIDFGSAKDVKSIIMRAPNDDYHLAPNGVRSRILRQRSDWNYALRSPMWSGNGQEETWTIGTPTSDPVDFPTTMARCRRRSPVLRPSSAGRSRSPAGRTPGRRSRSSTSTQARHRSRRSKGSLTRSTPATNSTSRRGATRCSTPARSTATADNFRGEPHVPGQDPSSVTQMHSMISREDVIAEARKWLETRWVHQGRACMASIVPDSGDHGRNKLSACRPRTCCGYAARPMASLFRSTSSSRRRSSRSRVPARLDCSANPLPDPHRHLRRADGQLTLIHAYMPYGKVVEEPFIHEWPTQLVAVRNYIGLID
jgi:hypothetical protein